MADLVVSAATGALTPLLKKLAAALVEDYKRFKSVRGEINSLTEELAAMHAFLLKMSEEEDPDVQDKAWMKEVRELSYDMEDSFDEFRLRVDDRSTNPEGLIDKFNNFVSKTKTRRRIAKAIDDLKIQIKEVGERNARYKTREIISKTSNADVDRRALAVFENVSKLVGLERPTNEVIEVMMTKKNGFPSQMPKVLSIVGSGGLGKTTLANHVYQKLKGNFESKAFISVSRNPDLSNVLRNILYQVNKESHPNIQDWDIHLLISKINDSLMDKRYLVVIDDIWTKDAWEIINYALYKNSKDSKIITTTRSHHVAKACCSSDDDSIYKMKPLAYAESKRLFMERLFGSEDKCPAHLIRVSNSILEKCDGLPLAIISISGLLANKALTEDEWGRVLSSIGRGLAKNPDVKSMMQILSLSYFDLPHYLKTCLLYLSIFPEDSVIDKFRLVRRWIAEGFIQQDEGNTPYELGERCFNELINRSLIQARDINMHGEVTTCQIHDTVLDFIVSKAEEENFASVFSDGYDILFAYNKVRRLSLQANSEDKVSLMSELNLSHVRSVTVFSKTLKLPSLFESSLLRVLDLQGCSQVEDHHIAGIGNLFQLKYLSLRGTGVCELPEEIKKLQYLETLDVNNSKVRELPPSIAYLRRLVVLVVGRLVKLPDTIGSMTALEDLHFVDMYNLSVDIIRKFGQLKNLRSICFLYYTRHWLKQMSCYSEHVDSILSALAELRHLHSLSINNIDHFSMDSRGETPRNLQKFVISGGFISKVPNWIGSLGSLQMLTLCVKQFGPEDILVLGCLQALVSLHLVADTSFVEGRVFTISGDEGQFRCLRRFYFGYNGIPVVFQAGAMQKLENLTVMFSYLKSQSIMSGGDYTLGINHLCSLESVEFILYVECDEARDLVNNTKSLVADLSCEEAKATLLEMRTIWNELIMDQKASSMAVMKGPKGVIKRAVDDHPKTVSLGVIVSDDWKIYEGMHSTFSVSPDVLVVVIIEVAKEIEVLVQGMLMRIEHCPLKGHGKCECQGIPIGSLDDSTMHSLTESLFIAKRNLYKKMLDAQDKDPR